MTEALKSDTRRYVGSRETMSYVLFDASKGFSIDAWKNRFFLDVVKIDLGVNALASVITNIWDIVDDTFAGVLVDKTATRWGKFRPYILTFALPGLSSPRFSGSRRTCSVKIRSTSEKSFTGTA